MALGRRVWLVILAVALAIGVLLYLNVRRPPPVVRAAPVTRADIKSVISSNGKVEPVDPSVLRALFDGFITRVIAMEGDTVKRGDPLLTMDDTALRAQLEQARAELTREQAALRVAQGGGRADELARLTGDLRAAEAQQALLEKQQQALTRLLAEHAATPDEVEKNRAALERARADVDHLRKAIDEFKQQTTLDTSQLQLSVRHSEAQIKDLQDKIASARVISPINGTLFSLPVHQHDFVHTGDLLAQVADLSKVRVRAFVDEPELGGLKPGLVVEVTWDAIPNRVWSGQIEAVPQQIVARGNRNVGEVLCSISNQNRELKPNATVTVRIQLSERKEVLAVPRAAVQVAGTQRYVYQVRDGQLHRQEVQLGISSDTQAEILGGLGEGDTVALPGNVPLRDGLAVRADIIQ